MKMAAVPNPRQMVTCPYNKAHQLEHYRMHIHLQKCRRQHGGSKKITCPIDGSHVVDDVELDYHVTICDKRYLLDSQLYVLEDDVPPAVQPAVTPVINFAGEDNWDDEVASSYKPNPGNNVYKKVRGATPSERRKARMEGVKTYRPPQ